MLEPKSTLARVKEILPDLGINMTYLKEALLLDKVEKTKWKDIFFKIFDYLSEIESTLSAYPDVAPFNEFELEIEDIAVLVHALFIFYDCEMKEYGQRDD